jgi:hypothetical protein
MVNDKVPLGKPIFETFGAKSMKAGPNHRSAPKGLDLHETPPVAVQCLLRVEQLPQVCWDPCAGPGSIVREIEASGRECYATDLVTGQDFLAITRPALDVEAIVMNPPYVLAAPFVSHALELVDEVYCLLRLNWFAAVRPAYPHIYDRLNRVHVFAPRLPLMHRADWTGKKATSQFDFAWYVWERKPPIGGGPVIDRVNWRKL